jgi:adenosine deaminase
MPDSILHPLGALPSAPSIAALPKADLHIHQEWSQRLDRILAARNGQTPYDWQGWVAQLLSETPPGIARLQALSRTLPVTRDQDTGDDVFIARVEDLLEEASTNGAVLVEVRFGNETVLRPGFMELFREAERRVRQRHPRLYAEAVVIIMLWYEPDSLEQIVQACIRAVHKGLSGIDFLYSPYDAEASWETAYRIGERAADAGLGVTAHAGEFSTANIAAAARVPGLTRLGHATFAGQRPELLELLANRNITVECCLSSNVVLGAVPSFEEHPIRRFVEHGIPVALGSDNPVQICTTIGREYALAHSLGFSRGELLAFTQNAIRAAFTTPERRQDLLDAE